MAKTLKVREGSTAPVQLTVSGFRIISGVKTALADLDDMSSAKLYMRKRGASTNHVDGATLTAGSAALSLIFDPATAGPSSSNAFGQTYAGTYDAYIEITWSDGTITKHPQDNDDTDQPALHVIIAADYQS